MGMRLPAHDQLYAHRCPQGSSGGQEGDPVEMIRFCPTIHPTWGLVIARHRQACAVAFSDDGYIDSEIKECLFILAELKQAFKEDCGLDLQLGSASASSTSRACR